MKKLKIIADVMIDSIVIVALGLTISRSVYDMVSFMLLKTNSEPKPKTIHYGVVYVGSTLTGLNYGYVDVTSTNRLDSNLILWLSNNVGQNVGITKAVVILNVIKLEE